MPEMERYTFNEFADLTARWLGLRKEAVVSISGPSCIGKSVLAQILREKMHNTTVQVICMDNYLKSKYRGRAEYRNGSIDILRPDAYDWELLKMHLKCLKQNQMVTYDIYQRGIGWGEEDRLYPGRIVILEGLFLDSIQALECINPDLLIQIYADDEFIRSLRLRRDEFYRNNFPNFRRSPNESIEEINNTLVSDKIYTRAPINTNYIKIFVDEGFSIRIMDSALCDMKKDNTKTQAQYADTSK